MNGEPGIGILTASAMRLLERQTKAIEQLREEVEKLAKANTRPLTSKEAAEFLGLSYSRFMQVYRHEIPCIQRNRKLLFEVKDLIEWMRKNKNV